jgi:hypothetical protein
VSNELGPELSSHYSQLIGIAQWAIELACINIHHEVSLLSQYQANPRVGHLEALYHVFAYMKSHLDIGRVAFDPKTPMVDESAFNNGADWKEFYGEVQEELPPKMPKLRGQRVTVSALLMLTMPETKLQDICTQVLSFMFRMLRSFGTVKDRI